MNLDIGNIVLQYVCLLFSLCVHEAAHAAMSNWCGDPSARLLGRLTLDPRKHADPFGTVVMPLLMMFTGVPYLFGWAKPVPFNPANLNNIRRDPVLIAMAGPVSNLLIALCCALALRMVLVVGGVEALGLIDPVGGLPEVLARILFTLIMINLLLMLFNLIPVPPLDGHYVLHYFLPRGGQEMLERIGPFGIIIAIIVANPWIAFSMPKMMHAVLWLATAGF